MCYIEQVHCVVVAGFQSGLQAALAQVSAPDSIGLKTWHASIASAERESTVVRPREPQCIGAVTVWARSAQRCLTPRSS